MVNKRKPRFSPARNPDPASGNPPSTIVATCSWAIGEHEKPWVVVSYAAITDIGPITASVLSSQLGDGKQYANSRYFTAST